MNQATVPRLSTLELIDAAARAGYGGVALWRERLEECGLDQAARRAATVGLEITSLCRAGFFLASKAEAEHARRCDNHRAIEEAAALGATTLALVCGPAPTRDLEEGRRRVHAAIAELAEAARGFGVSLALEPMHPLYCGDRSVVVTLAQALSIAHSLEGVGVLLDSYHLWWDPELTTQVHAARGAVLGVQLADWLAPPPHPLEGRGMLGDGTIDFAHFLQLVEEAGYAGRIEIEIFNQAVWDEDPIEILERSAERFVEVSRR